MKRTTCILVDDERLARENLRTLLQAHEQIEVVGEADSVETALAAIEDLQPQLLFLDIQMPGGTGFDLLERIENPPPIIFVTAFDRYAIRAFEINALDYLLKPVDPERLAITMQRVLNPASRSTIKTHALDLNDSVILDTGRKRWFAPLHSIQAIRSDGDYTHVRTADKHDILVRRTLRDWARALPEEHFVRIHRQVIVNVHSMASVERLADGRMLIRLKDNDTIYEVSRRRTAGLSRRLSGST